MKKAFFCLLIGFYSLLPLFAQSEDTNQARPAKGRVAWFVYTSMPEDLENPVSVMSGTDVRQITLSKRAPSDPVKIPADGILRIVRKVQSQTDPGKTEFQTLAQALIPEGMIKALVILMPAPENPKGLVFHTKVQDLARFKGGDWLYLNMTKVNVGVEMGKTSMQIKPGETKIYEAPAISEPLKMPIRYSYFHPVKQQWKMISASTIALYGTRREICIFGWDPRYDRIEKHGITFPVSQ